MTPSSPADPDGYARHLVAAVHAGDPGVYLPVLARLDRAALQRLLLVLAATVPAESVSAQPQVDPRTVRRVDVSGLVAERFTTGRRQPKERTRRSL